MTLHKPISLQTTKIKTCRCVRSRVFSLSSNKVGGYGRGEEERDKNTLHFAIYRLILVNDMRLKLRRDERIHLASSRASRILRVGT
jgi:hypothetical protein